MSEEWSLQPDLVDEHLEGILAGLKNENKDPMQCVDIVKERLIAALQPPPTVNFSLQYVDVEFLEDNFAAKTIIWGTKHFQGTYSSIRWMDRPDFQRLDVRNQRRSDGSATHVASNTLGAVRPGNLQIVFSHGGSTCGHYSGEVELGRPFGPPLTRHLVKLRAPGRN